MKKIAFLATAAALLTFAACNSLDPGRPDSAQPITINAAIGAPTRATITGNSEKFDTGDKVALYAWTGGASAVPAQRLVDGVENELQADGSWKPASPMFWADLTSTHYFLGVFPARIISDFTADSFTLKADDYEASDLLVATELSGLKALDGPVKLTFNHLMARLQVNMNFRSQFAATPTVAVVAKAASGCTVDYLAGSVKAGGQGSVALPKLASAAEGYALSHCSIMIPQSGFRTVTLTIDGTDYVYTHSEDIELQPGKITLLNLVVGRDKLELASDITIADWTAGSTLNGDALDED